ncbi:hypothetical protein [Sphingobacterium kitahiroshimense]|uniref:hypothetical protein n=1 Tax=Sphingobacterium kitahiroshimense TaxID=470446 RepID=UPI0010467602|nr:hypothetical protein [Sphingobacterium kitahiroshimense]MCW2260910.1 hypothetical protein [Sphingobacterium kitahiroshimense]
MKKITNNKEFMAKMAVITILVSLGQITGIALYYKNASITTPYLPIIINTLKNIKDTIRIAS